MISMFNVSSLLIIYNHTAVDEIRFAMLTCSNLLCFFHTNDAQLVLGLIHNHPEL